MVRLYLYGSLAAIIAKQFFAGTDPNTGFIFALLAFAAGFIVRPFGALVFGRLGDMIGRKYTFLVTILIMGASTFIVGILPNYASIGITAPIILIILRILQGLALGANTARGNLCCRTRSGRPSRRVHRVDPDDCNAGPVPVAAGDSGRAYCHRRNCICRLGLAHSVPGIDRSARYLGLDPLVDE